MDDFVPDFQPAKLDELVLYISERNLTNEGFGRSKLHKLLWMCDFHYFGLTGDILMGARYLRAEHGPICEPLDACLRRLEDSRQISIRIRDRFGYTQQRPVPLVRSDLSEFSADEIAAVEDVLWQTYDMSPHQISEHSHLHPGWKYTGDGEEIHYGFALAPINEPLEEAPAPPSD